MQNNTSAIPIAYRVTPDNDSGQFDLSNFAVNVVYHEADWSVYGNYFHQKIDNSITHLVDAEGVAFPHASIYDASLNMGRGGLRYAFTPAVAAGGELLVYKNKGTWQLDWQMYKIFVEFDSPAGYLLRVAYQRNEYDEKDFDFDDYGSNIVTVSVGYRF